MYYVDQSTGNIKKTSKADSYESKLKSLIEQKMRARNINQIHQKVLLDIYYEIELNENKDGSVSKTWRLDLDNLMKATIDSISHTIIKDDNFVYGVRARIAYKKKEDDSFLYPKNVVRFSVFDFNEETDKFFTRQIEKHHFYSETHTELSLDDSISIPSYNSMYTIENKKRILSTNASLYKRKLLTDYKNKYYESTPSKDYFAILATFWIYNIKERDVDNMLKATFDAFSKTVYADDKQILEFYAKKEFANLVAWIVDLKFHRILETKNYIFN